MVDAESVHLGGLLWDYHHVYHQVKKSDCIMVLGSHDLRVAERGAELWLQGFAPLLIFSGGLGNFTKDMWTESEADKFARIAIQLGVPAKNILVENKSSNTGENIQFTKKLLNEHGINPVSFILVQKPYMERRTYATFMKQWPDKEIRVTSPQISFEKYPTEDIPLERVISIMVGDLQRIIDYPVKGFQIYQEVPDHVLNAYEKLILLGFDSHLAK
jgi:uncharacterized SAM-binding protein YcdF (DUF218 family)